MRCRCTKTNRFSIISSPASTSTVPVSNIQAGTVAPQRVITVIRQHLKGCKHFGMQVLFLARGAVTPVNRQRIRHGYFETRALCRASWPERRRQPDRGCVDCRLDNVVYWNLPQHVTG